MLQCVIILSQGKFIHIQTSKTSCIGKSGVDSCTGHIHYEESIQTGKIRSKKKTNACH